MQARSFGWILNIVVFECQLSNISDCIGVRSDFLIKPNSNLFQNESVSGYNK